MKTPNLPKTIKCFDLIAAVKKAIKKEKPEEKKSYDEFDRLHDLYRINQWASDFGREPQDSKGTYYWDPASTAALPSSFSKYRSIVGAAANCARWNIEHTSGANSDEIVDFYGKFNVVNGIVALLLKKEEESKKPEYSGAPVKFKSVSYEFCGDIMKHPPKNYKFQFDIGTEHYEYALSTDYSKVSVFCVKSIDEVSTEPIKTIDAEKVEDEFAEELKSVTKEEVIDLADI